MRLSTPAKTRTRRIHSVHGTPGDAFAPASRNASAALRRTGAIATMSTLTWKLRFGTYCRPNTRTSRRRATNSTARRTAQRTLQRTTSVQSDDTDEFVGNSVNVD